MSKLTPQQIAELRALPKPPPRGTWVQYGKWYGLDPTYIRKVALGLYPKDTRKPARQGEEVSTAKLTAEQVMMIREERAKLCPLTYRRIIERHRLRVSIQTVYMAATGKTWSHLPGAVAK